MSFSPSSVDPILLSFIFHSWSVSGPVKHRPPLEPATLRLIAPAQNVFKAPPLSVVQSLLIFSLTQLSAPLFAPPYSHTLVLETIPGDDELTIAGVKL